MLHFYKSDDAGVLAQVGDIAHNAIVHMENPDAGEISRVAQALAIPLDFFEDSLDRDELPRIAQQGGATLIVVNAPRRIAGDAPAWRTTPVGVIHVQDHLVIVSREKLELVDDLLHGRHGDFRSYMKTRVSLLLFRAIAQAYDDSLQQINQQVAVLQKKIKSSYRNTELFALIALNKSLVSFSTALSAMAILYRRLIAGQDIRIHDEEKRRLHDILIDIRQAAEITEMRRESLSNLMDAYAAIIHNNLNSVLKVLTALTIIMVIPTMIGSIFSMNVALPYEEEWLSTVVVGAGMLLLSAALIFVFYKKKYLRQ
ncbi:magnesium transporter CorA family protein [Pseudomonas sp. S 311-6]|uniref:magnesium transporter CorA family protein n=1 Tax=Kerstersia gyiorum TaxID=206506 RepID=UPI0020984411|nr:magnesium transporter CorA family protein [Pseudomonas sp. S 311-6]